ncbi:hypothetical protein C3451_17180 [Enterobacter sp. 301B]|uniref:hypothetical protein n=1 Tax=Enterobacter sp. 301B TaxID=2079206 RepID=UPI000F55FB9B|nr:hypothetical protein [Enterobacter sp. 301B]RQN42655.1 hypothetical protein C3451_17180 [Enterobacter sp. 301B]
MKKVLLILALVSLVGCKPSAEKAVELGKSEVAADVRDPDSVKFRYLRFVQGEDSPDGATVGYVCGQINAKNGFGAYEGFSPFLMKISMKSKGTFSKGVTYSVTEKKIYTRFSEPLPDSYREKCGGDE